MTSGIVPEAAPATSCSRVEAYARVCVFELVDERAQLAVRQLRLPPLGQLDRDVSVGVDAPAPAAAAGEGERRHGHGREAEKDLALLSHVSSLAHP
jgi:hypothetical protein